MATATKERAGTRELIEEYEQLDRSAREAAARGEAVEAELKALRARRAMLQERLGWGRDMPAKLDQQIADLEAVIADTKAEFQGLRAEQAEAIRQARELLAEAASGLAAAEQRAKEEATRALEELRRAIAPAVAAIREAGARRQEVETLKSFIQCRRAGVGLQKPGCASIDELRSLLRELQEGDPTVEAAGSVSAVAAVARGLGI